MIGECMMLERNTCRSFQVLVQCIMKLTDRM